MTFFSWFKPYSSLPGYLRRTTVFLLGRLHIRIHDISADDATPFHHNHPFNYLTVVLRGSYWEESGTERLRVKWFAVHRCNFFHRIVDVKPNTKTLFIAWDTGKKWSLIKSPNTSPASSWVDHIPGVYSRVLSGKTCYSKFDSFWFKGHQTIEGATAESLPSINQTQTGELLLSLLHKQETP